jgi:hypothetical protein
MQYSNWKQLASGRWRGRRWRAWVGTCELVDDLGRALERQLVDFGGIGLGGPGFGRRLGLRHGDGVYGRTVSGLAGRAAVWLPAVQVVPVVQEADMAIPPRPGCLAKPATVDKSCDHAAMRCRAAPPPATAAAPMPTHATMPPNRAQPCAQLAGGLPPRRWP